MRFVLLALVLGVFATGCGSDAGDAASNASSDGGEAGQDSSAPVDAAVGDTSDAPTQDIAQDIAQDTPLPSCAPGFSFQPSALETGAINHVAFTFHEPLAYVEMETQGPGSSQQGALAITTEDPWTWSYPMTFDTAGVWTFTFRAGDPSVIYGTCTRHVADTGAPPALPSGSCDGKVCGESDGMGGTCTSCPMVGTCLDPPSPYGPSGPGSWACLDNAGCQDWGQCQIWCPGEPCDSNVHSDGCPQGVEACFVDPHVASYEEACKTCCESRHHAPTGEYACWDGAFSLCRYPGDCGKPLLNPP